MTVEGAARRSAEASRATGSWTVDTAATTASFTARNFGVREVRGTIAVTAGRVTVDPTGRPLDLRAVADLTTLRTDSQRRDADLAGRRFFDVEHHPELVLVAHRFEEVPDGWRVAGSLEVRGTAAPLDLHVEAGPPPAEPGAAWRVVATGTVDLRATPIRVPRVLVGRFVTVRVESVLTCRQNP